MKWLLDTNTLSELAILVARDPMPKFAMADLNFSPRASERIFKAARTIAGLAGSENLVGDHISEAMRSRSLDRQLWTGSENPPPPSAPCSCVERMSNLELRPCDPDGPGTSPRGLRQFSSLSP